MKLKTILLASVAAAACIATPLAAQDIEPPSDDGTIVVTGTREEGYRATVAPQVNKTDTPLQEIPFAVQVVTRELIEDRGIDTIGEALRYTPGLSPQVGFGASNDRFTIRGFTVPFNHKNGFRRSGFSANDQLANIEQIEILKGPASALYGRTEGGGVVNIVTKKPLDALYGEVAAEYGSFDALRLTADLSAPLSDTLGVRLNASYDDRESFRDLLFAKEFFIAPVVKWQPGDRTTLTVEGEYSERDAFFDRGFGNSPLFLEAPRDRQFGNEDARQERDGGLATVVLEHGFSDTLSARLAGSYSEVTLDGLFYGFGFPAVSGADGPNPLVNVRPTDSFDRQTNFTTQAELYGSFDTGPISHKLLIGAEYGEDTWDYLFLAGPTVQIEFDNPVFPTPTAQGPFTPSIDGGTDADAFAIYAQDELAFGDFRLLIGGRYDWNTVDNLDRVFGPDPRLEREESKFSPRAGLTWTPIPEVSLYASWSRSFVPQNFGLLRGGGLPTALEGDAFEAGAKLSFLDGRIRPTISVFDIERSGAAVSDPDDFNFVIQVGESRTRGVEVEVPAAITPRWRLIANYTHLDAEVTNDTSIPEGTRLINAPDHSVSVWTTYDVGGALEGLSMGTGVLYIGERAGNSFGSIELPDYARVDANLSYTFDIGGNPLKAQLNLLNLFDEFYYDSGGPFLPIYPGAPRTVSASLSYRFGAGQ